MVDIITAGFPCQPFSVAGKQLGENDPRNMWPATIQAIRIIRPGAVFLENVPALLSNKYTVTIFRDLRENGYEALPPLVLGAHHIGANHKRDRAWIVAHSDQRGSQQGRDVTRRETRSITYRRSERPGMANPQRHPSGTGLCEGKSEGKRRGRSGNECGEVSDASGDRNRLRKHEDEKLFLERKTSGEAGGPISEGGCEVLWATEPALGRVAHGVANRVDRLKAIGNGQVPQVAATAWNILTQHKGITMSI